MNSAPTVFPSKRDRWFVVIMIPAFAMMIFALVVLIPAKDFGAQLIGLPLTILGLVVSVSVFVKTDYTIDGATLIARSGVFKWRVPIADIQRVYKTDDFTSGPALSLDRIMIVFNRGYERHELLVSPADAEGFIAALKSQNPSIAVD
jgi:hypothetical protein